MLSTFLKENILSKSMSYESFMEISRSFLTQGYLQSNETDKARYENIKLNYHRSQRIQKTYKINQELSTLVKSIQRTQTWLVITENWCGDSAQNLPIISVIASQNQLILLRIIERDKNLELMDMYLTNGSRSIPKLIALDENYDELFRWGPRPKAGQDYFNMLKENGTDKKSALEKLHLWYSQNRGSELEKEFTQLISAQK